MSTLPPGNDPILLAFSGGLDTSFLVPWVAENTGRPVITVTVDTGGIDAAAAQLLGERSKALGAIARFVREIKTAGPSITVIKTFAGAAGSVAVAIDRSGWPEVVGTISGDDTIFLATQDGEAQSRLLSHLRSVFRI